MIRPFHGIAAALLLASCGKQSPEPESDPAAVAVTAGNEAAAVAEAPENPVGPAATPQAPAAALLPIARAAIERELEPGAGCSLDPEGTSGDPLLVAVAGDAIANVDGRIVHLKPSAPDLDALFEGGNFTGEGLTITVRPDRQVGQMDEVTSWRATVRLRSPGGERTGSYRWSCGA